MSSLSTENTWRPRAIKFDPESLKRHSDPGGPNATARRAVLVAIIVCTGYLTFGRPFAYIGIPQANLFLAEILLVASFIWRQTRAIWAEFGLWLTRPGRAHLLAWALVLNLAYGLFEIIRGLLLGNSLLDALKMLTLNYDPFFLILGVWLARTSPSVLNKVMLAVCWTNATYGVVQVFGLSHLNTTFPGQPGVVLFDLAPSAALSILWLAANPGRTRFTWVLLPLNGIVLLGHQVRAEWFALIAGLVVLLVVRRQLRQLVTALVGVVGLLLVLSLSGLTLPSSASRGGNISVSSIVGRAISPFAPDEAAKLAGADTASATAGTAQWRSRWWHAIAHSAQSDPTLGLLGHGYGFQLSSLTTGVTSDIRTPHDIYYYLLGYGGYLGVAVFALLLLALLQLVWRSYRITGDIFGLLFLTTCFVIGLTTPWFETPVGATPTFLVLGMAIAPAITRYRTAGTYNPYRAGIAGTGRSVRPRGGA